jgi:hypothetical protein
MSTGEAMYVVGALVAVMGICSVPLLVSLRGAGPRYRVALIRQLGVGWAVGALLVGWLALGWFALEADGRWLRLYREVTLVLMGAFFPLLVIGIRAGNRAAAAAQAADRDLIY